VVIEERRRGIFEISPAGRPEPKRTQTRSSAWLAPDVHNWAVPRGTQPLTSPLADQNAPAERVSPARFSIWSGDVARSRALWSPAPPARSGLAKPTCARSPWTFPDDEPEQPPQTVV